MAWYNLLNPFKKGSENKIIEKSSPNYGEGIVFFDSMGNIVGNGSVGFNKIISGQPKPSFHDITEQAYGRSPWVYIIVDRIAKSCMKMWSYTDLVNADGEPISDTMRMIPRVSSLQNLINNPQEEFQGFSFEMLIYTCISNYLLNGNGYMMGLPVNQEGEYTTLITPLAQNVSTNDDAKARIQFYTVNYYNLTFSPATQDMLHMRLPNLTQDLYEGHSPMQSLVNIWKANNALNSNEQWTHERRGSNAVIYSKANRPLTESERKVQQAQMDQNINNIDRVGRYTYMPTEVGFIDLSKSFKDLQAIESNNKHRETVAAAYNYPVVLLNDTTQSTYNNQKEAEKTALVKSVLPVYDFFLSLLNSWLVQDNFGLETVSYKYKEEDIPEMNLVNKDRTENNDMRIDMVLKINRSIADGAMTMEKGINTLVIAGGFTEAEAEELIIEDRLQTIEENGEERIEEETQE